MGWLQMWQVICQSLLSVICSGAGEDVLYHGLFFKYNG
jgi:hypothetical protein